MNVLLESAIAMMTAVMVPVVCLAVIVLLPFSDRPTQAALLGSWSSYIFLLMQVL